MSYDIRVDWFRVAFPYYFEKLEHPRYKHVYLPLNRNYKPLGYAGKEWVRYEDYAHAAVRFRSDPYKFPVWRCSSLSPTPMLHLYNDANRSLEGYWERLGYVVSRATLLHPPAPGLNPVPGWHP